MIVFRILTSVSKKSTPKIVLETIASHSASRTARNFHTSIKMSVTESQYGSWKSPISSQLVSESSRGFQEVRVDSDQNNAHTVYWSEMRYDEGGRYVICSQKKGDKTFTSWTPEGFNARTKVHEYGGGATFVRSGTVYFCNFKDQRMYSQSSAVAAPSPITPDGKGWRYADGILHPKHGRIYCVREDHGVVDRKEAKEAVNTIVTIDPKDGSQNILAQGKDFYSSPRVSPDGKKIAWVEWCHPNMPWDSTELWVADLSEDGATVVDGTAKKIAGGEDNSVIKPGWTPANELLYIGDQTDWWNLYHVTSSGEHVNLLPREKEIGGPQWVFGDDAYVVQDDGTIVTLSGKELGILNMKTKEYKLIETGYTSHNQLCVAGDGTIYCVAGSPTKFSCVIQVHHQTDKVDIHVLRESKNLSMDTGYFSIPTEITWSTTDDGVSHGYFYRPQNKDFKAPEGTLPPLLVKAHGGPTGATSSILNLKNQYFTSRGIAILDINYRGSTGYGKKYRNQLRKKWGIYDVDDACTGAQHLADKGQVDSKALCIDGGSAGGYTTLACLAFKDVFKAGASHYGIGDLEVLARDTHKFESRYLDNLVAPYTPEFYSIYKERSPFNYVDKLDCAMALFQGDEDKVVPPNQAEMMHKAVKEKGLPVMYVLFKGEQHGFRKAENIQTALDGEFYFFSKVFKFQSADKEFKLPIDNLPE